jgi:hypothetical protein
MSAETQKHEPQPEYWLKMMSNRYPANDEANRLYTVLYGFYARQDEYTSILSFYNEAKRPYGNKDVAASIAYNLGWDSDRLLMYQGVPDDVAREAMDVHRRVGHLIYEEIAYALT